MTNSNTVHVPLLQNIKMIFGTKISATYVDSFCDALVAWKMLLQTASLNWFFCAALYTVRRMRNKL